MSFKGRVTRFALAVGVAGLISAQVPMSSGVALADDGYNFGGGNSAKVPIEIAVVGLIGYGIFSSFSGGNAASASTAAPAGATTDAGIAPVLPGDAPVWDVASSNSDLSDFAVAADKADLKNQLRDTGNYTVFAPTHAAFAALPAGTLATLEQPANQTALKQLLSLHIVPANRYTIAQLKTLPGATADPGASLTTLTGSPIYVKYTPGASTTDIGSLAVSGQPFGPNNETGIAVTQTDIPARNGVIHPIGAVLPLPTATTATP